MLVQVSEAVGKVLITTGQGVEVIPSTVNAIVPPAPAFSDNLFGAIGRPAFDPADTVVVISPAGKSRRWPTPHPTVENGWGYATRVSQIINPATGAPFFDPNQLGRYGLGAPGGAEGQAEVAAGQYHYTADRMMYPAEWEPAPQSGGVRTGAPMPHDDAHGSLDPSVIAEWQALPADDRDRGTWLNRKGTEVARLLLNNGYMSHADSARYDLAAGGYTQ